MPTGPTSWPRPALDGQRARTAGRLSGRRRREAQRSTPPGSAGRLRVGSGRFSPVDPPDPPSWTTSSASSGPSLRNRATRWISSSSASIRNAPPPRACELIVSRCTWERPLGPCPRDGLTTWANFPSCSARRTSSMRAASSSIPTSSRCSTAGARSSTAQSAWAKNRQRRSPPSPRCPRPRPDVRSRVERDVGSAAAGGR